MINFILLQSLLAKKKKKKTLGTEGKQIDPRLLLFKISLFCSKQSKHSQEIIRVRRLKNFMSVYLFLGLSLYEDFDTSYVAEFNSRELPIYTEWHYRWVQSIAGFVLFV